MAEPNVKPNLDEIGQKLQAAVDSKENIRVPIVAAILMAGEIFRKGLKENEAAAVASRLVGVAKVIVDAADKS